MDSKNNFSVHYQTWKNKKAVHKVLTEFRNYFPNNPIRLVSDNGETYNDYVDEFNVVYDFKNSNVFPGGRFGNISHCYEWLYRVNETCQMFDTEWVVIFEDDVLTQSDKIEYPYSDAGGFIVNRWTPTLEFELKLRNNLNLNWGYGMCGGSIFKRRAFLDSYKKLDEFPLEKLSKMDDRVIGWSDTLINCFLQYFGYTYQIWDGMDDMSYPSYNPKEGAVFVHGYKELY
jgi:hypothetical protein